MVGLARTALETSRKVHLAASAIAGQDDYGAITELSMTYEVSRPTVYSARDQAQTILECHFDTTQGFLPAHTVVVDYAQLQRAIVALRVVSPNSLRAIEILLPLLYPGLWPSYGTIQGICAQAQTKAASFNLSCTMDNITAGALDEMFSQGDPVLAGVDLDSGFLFGLSLEDSRGGEQWAKLLRAAKAQGLDLEVAVKDAALGIAKGVEEVFPEAEQRDDCFHAQYEMGKVRHTLESRAYGAIAAEMEAEQKLSEVRRTGRGKRSRLAAKLRWARRHCQRAMALYDRFDTAARRATEAMELVDLARGNVREPEEMRKEMEQAAEEMMTLGPKRCRKVGRYIKNRAAGLAHYAQQVRDYLATLTSFCTERSSALGCIIWRLVSDLRNHRRPWQRQQDVSHLVGALSMLRDEAGEHADKVLEEVDTIMALRHRASSAIEGFNAALRPFLHVHKRVTQGFLELFRAYHNLRTRRWGRFKGTSPFQCLTGQRVDDWLTLLGYPVSANLN